MADEFSQPKLIVGEGKLDQRFFTNLCDAHTLAGFEARHPVVGNDSSGGIDKLGRYLEGLSVATTFTTIQKIVIAGDNDDEDAFARICDQLEIAGYSCPDAPRTFVKTVGKPELAILLIPNAHPGCLETLCYKAASNKWPALTAPLATYFGATSAPNWIVTKQEKMRVECVLASTCEQNPQVALADIWQKNEQFQIPLTDAAFQDIVDFLQTV